MILLGIDCGLSGAVSFLDTRTRALRIEDMPTLSVGRGGKARRDLDPHTLRRWLDDTRPAHAFVEQAQAMPKQSAYSTGIFFQQYGMILGLLVGAGVPHTVVAPVTWKRALRVPAAKDGARARASELLPDWGFHWQRKRDDGRAEAALIVAWGEKQFWQMAAGGEAA